MSLRAVCDSSGSWQILASSWQDVWYINKIEVQGQGNGHHEVWAGQNTETISTKSKSEASETDTESDKNEALRIWERLRSPVGAETPNRELRDDVLDVILLPNGDPLGVHFWPRANFERFLSDFGTT